MVRSRFSRCRTWLGAAALYALAGSFATATVAAAQAAPNRPVFVVPNRANGPFSSVVRVDHMLYVSGQIGTDSTGTLPKGTRAQTIEAMKRISNLLTQAGSGLDRVAKCTVMLVEMKDWNEMNEAYISFFPQRRPARSSFGATALALGALVEIECMATVD